MGERIRTPDTQVSSENLNCVLWSPVQAALPTSQHRGAWWRCPGREWPIWAQHRHPRLSRGVSGPSIVEIGRQSQRGHLTVTAALLSLPSLVGANVDTASLELSGGEPGARVRLHGKPGALATLAAGCRVSGDNGTRRHRGFPLWFGPESAAHRGDADRGRGAR